LINDVCYQSTYEPYFKNLTVSDADVTKYIINAEQFKKLVLNNVKTLKNPMWPIKKNGEWVIYFHIENWEGPVTATAITNLRNRYQILTKRWLNGLSTFDPEAPTSATIKIFGFVFNEGVEIDQSFYDTYGDYPIVTNWNQTDEESPWKVVYRSNGSTFNYNWYGIADFTTLKVVGNREGLSSNINFSPQDWTGYTHPESVDMFFTKFWHKTTWDAVAQRQYLKIGGGITNYETGETIESVFTHEMGHCFFHDDIYAISKYPDATGLSSIMNSASSITNFDRVIQRMIWETQK